MVMPQQIKEWIEQGLEEAWVEIDGDGRHFNAIIVSPAFDGKNAVQQHQLVYSVLGDKMKSEIHALSMRTLTPEQWQKQQRGQT